MLYVVVHKYLGFINTRKENPWSTCHSYSFKGQKGLKCKITLSTYMLLFNFVCFFSCNFLYCVIRHIYLFVTPWWKKKMYPTSSIRKTSSVYIRLWSHFILTIQTLINHLYGRVLSLVVYISKILFLFDLFNSCIYLNKTNIDSSFLFKPFNGYSNHSDYA